MLWIVRDYNIIITTTIKNSADNDNNDKLTILCLFIKYIRKQSTGIRVVARRLKKTET